MKRLIVTALLVISTPAFAADQPADPAFMQRAADVIANQRNNALNAAAVAEAKLAGVTEELTKAQARIKELEADRKK